MTHPATDMLKLIHETKVLSIWDRVNGPVFWYAAGVPGPFYVNTEKVIGADLADNLLNTITDIMKQQPTAETRAVALNDAVMKTYRSSKIYQDVIGAMVVQAKKELTVETYAAISGGERRDWIFSIPFAVEIGKPHLYLFKDLSMYCADALPTNAVVFHVADLINNAASHFEKWFPALEKAGLRCVGTSCVNTRGVGTKKLVDAGVKVASLANIDLAFFAESQKNGLISKDTLDEITVHFTSPQEWAKKYLLTNSGVFNVAKTDQKSFERLESFVAQDPWNLRAANPEFFTTMQSAIDARKKAAA
jgi:orotate phosphoribosyltransferase